MQCFPMRHLYRKKKNHSEDDIDTRILLLLKIYVELRLLWTGDPLQSTRRLEQLIRVFLILDQSRKAASNASFEGA